MGIDPAKPGAERTVLGIYDRSMTGMTPIAEIPDGVSVQLQVHNGKPYALLVAPWMPPALLDLTGANVRQRIELVCKKPR